MQNHLRNCNTPSSITKREEYDKLKTGNPYQFDCEKCGKSFENKHIMMFHYFRICGKNICPKNEENSIVNCRKCNTGFCNENSFMNHLNKCNGDSQKRREKNSPNKSKLETDDQMLPPSKQPKLEFDSTTKQVSKEVASVEEPEAVAEVIQKRFCLNVLICILKVGISTKQMNDGFSF